LVLRTYKGVIERLYTTPPPGSVVVCLDEMGPESANSFPRQQLVHAGPQPDAVPSESQPGAVPTAPQPGATARVRRAERAKQEIDYGRRGKGYISGAFRPAAGEALTHPYPSRSTANWADFLGRVEAWIPAEVERIYAIVDNLRAHRAVDVLLFALAFARWEFVFQPKYAAYLNLIEPWWKVLRSLALKGRRFESWEEACRAVLKRRRPTRISIGTHSSGAVVVGTAHGDGRGSRRSPASWDLPDEPFRIVALGGHHSASL
jgi:hypothetical protein